MSDVEAPGAWTKDRFPSGNDGDVLRRRDAEAGGLAFEAIPDLSALEALSGTGLAGRTAPDTLALLSLGGGAAGGKGPRRGGGGASFGGLVGGGGGGGGKPRSGGGGPWVNPRGGPLPMTSRRSRRLP